MENEIKKCGYVLVAINDTKDWSLREKDKSDVEKIETVYLINLSEITHLCSLEGSYWAKALYSRVVCKDGIDREEEIEADLEMHLYLEDTYLSEKFVDDLISKGVEGTDYRLVENQPEILKYDEFEKKFHKTEAEFIKTQLEEFEEDTVEYYRCNWNL